jgi:hypothetical protein
MLALRFPGTDCGGNGMGTVTPLGVVLIFEAAARLQIADRSRLLSRWVRSGLRYRLA